MAIFFVPLPERMLDFRAKPPPQRQRKSRSEVPILPFLPPLCRNLAVIGRQNSGRWPG